MKTRKELKNKKGFLLGDVIVKVVIAFLCILLLIIFGAKLFGMFSKENDSKKAENNLNLISDKIAYLNSPEYTESFLYVTVFPPEKTGWFITSYNPGYFPEKQCDTKNFKSCLCICNSVYCDGLKACNGFEQEIIVDSEASVPVAGGAGTAAMGGVAIYRGVLEFKSSPQELKISKEDNIIKIARSDRQ